MKNFYSALFIFILVIQTAESLPKGIIAYPGNQNKDSTQCLIKRSTFGNSSIGNLFNSSCGHYSVCQTIGQQSITGTVFTPSYIVMQGYLQPTVGNIQQSTASSNMLKITCFPNPTKDFLYINVLEKVDDMVYVKIFDCSGSARMILQYPKSRTIRINVNSLPVGIYIVKILSANKSYTSKLSKF